MQLRTQVQPPYLWWRDYKWAMLRLQKKQLSINLPDGEVLKSTHTCNIIIPGLPTVLTGHIVQGLMMASLVRIRILCKSGCQVIFTEEYCNVMYNRKFILRGYKDPQTDLWTLPITPDAIMQQSTVGKVLEEEVPTSSTSWSGTLTSLLNTPLIALVPWLGLHFALVPWLGLHCPSTTTGSSLP